MMAVAMEKRKPFALIYRGGRVGLSFWIRRLQQQSIPEPAVKSNLGLLESDSELFRVGRPGGGSNNFGDRKPAEDLTSQVSLLVLRRIALKKQFVVVVDVVAIC